MELLICTLHMCTKEDIRGVMIERGRKMKILLPRAYKLNVKVLNSLAYRQRSTNIL